jgi:hypothetical protein
MIYSTASVRSRTLSTTAADLSMFVVKYFPEVFSSNSLICSRPSFSFSSDEEKLVGATRFQLLHEEAENIEKK